MKSSLLKTLIPAVIVIAVIVFYTCTFVVQEQQIGLKMRLGEFVTQSSKVDGDASRVVGYGPGLHFKIPLINQVRLFDARLQSVQSQPERFLTSEKKDVIVDSFAKWRIQDLGRFYRATGGNYLRANQLLLDRITTNLRDEFGKRTIQEVVADDRLAMMQLLTDEVNRDAKEYFGIEVRDVRIKTIDLPEEVSESVYQRMRAERERVARDLRARGEEASDRIKSEADRQRTVIVAEANRDADKLRGEGEAKAAEIYANAYNQDKEFYGFYRSLQAYRDSFKSGEDMILVQPDSDFFRYFRNAKDN